MAAWIALVLLDVVAVSTFARCFTGPGELALVIPMCVGAHIVAHLARRAGGGRTRFGSLSIWALAIVLVVVVPVFVVDGATLTWLLPLGRTLHAVDGQLHAAWHVFSFQVAPVQEADGLVLAAAWAAGVLGLAAEALDADTTLPAIVALVPAFDIVMFTATLGTPAGRAPELAALAGLAVWYLTATRRRASSEQVVTARVEGTPLSPQPAESATATPRASRLFAKLGTPVPGLVIVAAFAAGVIGPLAPGAQTSAVVSWHGSGQGDGDNGGDNGAIPQAPIQISQFIQVGQIEIKNANTPLFTVTGHLETREILLLLDQFNGDQWTPLSEPSYRTLPPFGSTLIDVENDLPATIVGKDSAVVTQVIKDLDLGGDELPAPGTPTAVDGFNTVTEHGSDGPLQVEGIIGDGINYGVKGVIGPSPDVAQEFFNPSAPAAPAVDLYYPPGLPHRILSLAQSLVKPGMTYEQKADAIQDYLLSNFTYNLPTSVPSGDSRRYQALYNFLFDTKSGYCQQFASAFAVLARIDGLPTRIAIGFLPNPPRNGTWVVTGTDVHAWPQVYFPGAGWVDYEPTPGSGTPQTAPITTTTAPGSTVPGSTVTSGSGTLSHCRSCAPEPGGTNGVTTLPTTPVTPIGAGTKPKPPGSSGPTDVLLALLSVALLWVIAVPSVRRLQARRRRAPASAVLFAWHDAVVALAAAGLHRRRAETLEEFCLRVTRGGVLSDEADNALRGLVRLTNLTYFAQRPPTAEEAGEAASDALIVRRSARRSISRWLQFVMEIDPRDLLNATG